ncbi:group 1 truncated hemoglobin [Halomonas sp. PAMB 3232]|uniref:group I truncated hemoglobin n=1 Tax=Halomonas sp. PAMB 3232 TaxID=3075221 RepID=UPI0028976F68|nr:group 1 truncated hemoglobin [Halomonas sp. PAMB 3232]WNL37424.1 group 1 truncated hemoglobin [Halomonas sp. PAMB 3232]
MTQTPTHAYRYQARRALQTAALITILLSLGGCAHIAPSTTLYERLGGESGIEAVVERFLYRVADDPELVGFFANTNIDHLAGSLANQFCAVSNGPCRYEGPPMERAHQNMGITDAHFNQLVEHLAAALREENIALGAQNELLGRLAPMHADVMRYQ